MTPPPIPDLPDFGPDGDSVDTRYLTRKERGVFARALRRGSRPVTPDDTADIHDEGWSQDGSGWWLGVLFIAIIFTAMALVAVVYQWRM